MEILKIVEVLQSYTEDAVAYKLDSRFACAVTEAVALLIGQGEQIADLENKLAVGGEVWFPPQPGLAPKPFVSVLGHMTDAGEFPSVRECYRVDEEHYFFPALQECHPISGWTPLPEPPENIPKG